MRVAFVLRSVEVQPLFRDLCKATTLVVCPCQPTHPLDPHHGSHTRVGCVPNPHQMQLFVLLLLPVGEGTKTNSLPKLPCRGLVPVLVWFDSRQRSKNVVFCCHLQSLFQSISSRYLFQMEFPSAKVHPFRPNLQDILVSPPPF